MEPVPLYNAPALLIDKKTVVIADLHIGIEKEYRNAGLNMPSQTKKLSEKIIKLCDEAGIKKLIILGDIKHSIPGMSHQEYREIPALFEKLTAKYDVEIAVGNHDGNISAIIPGDIKMHSSRGFSFQGIGLFHGHAHPSERVLKAKNLVAAHIHPIVSFDMSFGTRMSEPCWLKAKLKNNPEKSLVIMPAFNPLCGSAINSHKLIRARCDGKAKAFPSNVRNATAFRSSERNISELEIPHICSHAFAECEESTIFRRKIGENRTKSYEFAKQIPKYKSYAPILKLIEFEESDVYLLDGTLLGKVRDVCDDKA